MSSLLSSARFEGRMSQLQLEHLEHKEKLLFMSMEAIGPLAGTVLAGMCLFLC